MNSLSSTIDALRNHLERGHWLPGERMPPIRKLAQQYGVSRSTLQRALKVLQSRSLVHVAPRGAIIAGSAESAPSRLPKSSGLLWEQLKGRIGEDVLSGAFPGNQLPPTNKLALMYDVAIPTLRKAVRALRAEGLLTGHGSHLVSARSSTARRIPRLVLIAPGENGTLIATPGALVTIVAQSFERGCQRLHFESRTIGHDERNPAHLLQIGNLLNSITDIAGFVVATWSPYEEIYRSRWNEMIAMISKRDVPVTIIDLSGNFSLAPSLLRQNNVRMLRSAGKRAGAIVGESLLRRGHRRIAYVTSYFSVFWAKDRYDGLCEHLTTYGGPDAKIDLFALSDMFDIADLVVEYLGLDKEQLRILLGERYMPDTLSVMLHRLDRVQKKGLIGPLGNDPRAKAVRAEARRQTALMRGTHDPQMMSKLFDVLYDRASTYALEHYLAPLFKRAASGSPHSAWVISDDKTATIALEYLSQNHAMLRKDLSVVSFDNSSYSFLAELSSFDFNIEGVVSLALSMIADPKILKSKPAITEVDGYVVERRTTRR